MRTCRIDPAGLGVVTGWLEDRRPEWDRRLDRLGALLGEEESERSTWPGR